MVEGVHHSRKLPHQQVNYSETVHKLSKLQESVPVYLKREDAEPTDKKVLKYKEYHEQMNETVRREKDLNERKRLYNRLVYVYWHYYKSTASLRYSSVITT